MADDFLSRAGARLSDLEKDAAALAAQEEGVRRRRAEIQKEADELRTSMNLYRKIMQVMEDVRATETQLDTLVTTRTIADLAADMMRARGGRMRVANIVGQLEGIGRMRPRADNSNYGNVYRALTRDVRFVKSAPGEFGLREIVPTGSQNGSMPDVTSELERPVEQSPVAVPG